MYVFVKSFRQAGIITERDYQAYATIWELLIGTVPVPDLLIYIQAPIESLTKRIQKRNRSSETGIPTEYLLELEQHYGTWIDGFTLCPVVRIDGSEIDFIADTSTLMSVVSIINQTVAGQKGSTP